MFPDCSYGGPRRAGQDPSSVRAHLVGDHPFAIWQGCTCRLPRVKPMLQHIRLCVHDPDRIAVDPWHCGDPLRGCHRSHPSGRYYTLSPVSNSVRSCLTSLSLVVLYTAVGGLKATFLTDYLHTAVALILIIYFTLSILSHEAIGGLYGLYDKVTAVAADNYIPGNYQGSLLTMKSHDAIIWGLILKFGNLALVVMVRLTHLKTRRLPAKTLTHAGHRFLAKVLRDGSQRHRSRLQSGRGRHLRRPLGPRDGRRAGSPRHPRHPTVPHLARRVHAG